MKSISIIAIGDELLNGSTNDTNTQWIKAKLSDYDIKVTQSIIIPDDR